ncbi:MAG: division/cell wall cluster transcriptional repressor MraZ [Eubacteriales bacterium]|nr:division/cell wall cluster transcriptional repressor MraZ [Eubacteriales bacterium]
MFMGEYAHSLDSKGRLIIPSKFREALGEKFVITRSLDQCLCIYDMEDWEKFVSRLSSIPYNVKKQRQLVRFFLSGANEVEPDKQGRVLIPGNLREAAGIDRDVILVGVGSRIEVWSAKAWEENMTSDEINEIAEEMLGNGFEI